MLHRLLAKILVILVKFYQKALSPWLGSNCRFNPTCSHYMLQAVAEHGPYRGFWLGLKRLGRCHPWSAPGHDPVPPNDAKKK
jgi:uncharacterized protein